MGCSLIVDGGTRHEVACTVVEVEAYLGTDDPASHAFRGPTRRAAIMFGDPGRLYVYFSYGVHHCANVVTRPAGTAGAVLLRAAVVDRGETLVRQRRGAAVAVNRLLSGPGNLCRGLAVDLRDNGMDVSGTGRLVVARGSSQPELSAGPRVGITRAAELPLRFWWQAHPAVSRA